MKVLSGILFATLMMIVMGAIGYALNIHSHSHSFLTGWFSCMAYDIGRDTYDIYHN